MPSYEKEKLIEEIVRLLQKADEEILELIYRFSKKLVD